MVCNALSVKLRVCLICIYLYLYMHCICLYTYIDICVYRIPIMLKKRKKTSKIKLDWRARGSWLSNVPLWKAFSIFPGMYMGYKLPISRYTYFLGSERWKKSIRPRNAYCSTRILFPFFWQSVGSQKMNLHRSKLLTHHYDMSRMEGSSTLDGRAFSIRRPTGRFP